MLPTAFKQSSYEASIMRWLRTLFALPVLSFCLLTGCAVHLIMDYDSVLDQSISTAQANTEQFLSQMDTAAGTSAAAFSANQAFYTSMDAQLRTIAVRAKAEPRSDIVVKQVTELQGSFSDLKGLHQLDGDKGLSHDEINAARNGLENEFLSMLTLQLALKNRLKTPMTAPSISK